MANRVAPKKGGKTRVDQKRVGKTYVDKKESVWKQRNGEFFGIRYETRPSNYPGPYTESYFFPDLSRQDVAHVRRFLYNSILLLHTARNITIVRNDGMLKDIALVSTVGCMRLKGPLNAPPQKGWTLERTNNTKANLNLFFKDVSFPHGITCVNSNTYITTLRPGDVINIHGEIQIGNNHSAPGHARSCDPYFNIHDNGETVLTVETYRQKSVDTLVGEALVMFNNFKLNQVDAIDKVGATSKSALIDIAEVARENDRIGEILELQPADEDYSESESESDEDESGDEGEGEEVNRPEDAPEDD